VPAKHQKKRSRDTRQGNFVSEWYAHRVYPIVRLTSVSIDDQTKRSCPILSTAKGTSTECVKNEKPGSRGVCTISSASNGPRQDWVVCPYRFFDPVLLATVAAKLYRVPEGSPLHVFPAPALADEKTRRSIRKAFSEGKRVVTFFDTKLGGEISLSATTASPELAFDVTFVELLSDGNGFALGKFCILEIQTMDFHGSYGSAVRNLEDGLRLHKRSFSETLAKNQDWLSEDIEGPNIANVFKRTFYQLMFKFGFGASQKCAGAALIIPVSVWDSWQKFLGAPKLTVAGNHFLLLKERPAAGIEIPAWIFVVDLVSEKSKSPSTIALQKLIGTNAESLAHYALVEAPKAASEALLSEDGIYRTLRVRLQQFWPVFVSKATN